MYVICTYMYMYVYIGICIYVLYVCVYICEYICVSCNSFQQFFKCVLEFANLYQDRRKIESEFFGGNLCGIAATNALELGIDVGQIDATLHLGFPGSIAR